MGQRGLIPAVESLEQRLARLEALAASLAGSGLQPKVIPLERTAEPMVGWRIWPVFPWEDITGGHGVRLGSYNGHHAWAPRQPLQAACNGLLRTDRKHHDAPQLGCNCGVWAFRTSELMAEKLEGMRDWMHDNVGPSVEYAVGQVRLWGRVIEFEKGFRAEKAYPYAITIYSHEETTARMLRSEYLIDVDWQAWEPLPDAKEEEEEGEEEARRFPRQDPLGEVSFEETLTGVIAALASDLRKEYPYEKVRPDDGTVRTFQVTSMVERARGFDTHGHANNHENDMIVKEALRDLSARGLVEHGLVRSFDRSKCWRLTDAGLAVARSVLDPDGELCARSDGETIAVAEALALVERRPTVLFVDEIDAVRQAGREPRKRARARGRAAFRVWLGKQRATVEGRLSLYYTDAEITAAVKEASRLSVRRGDGPLVGFVAIMDRLAPGKYTTEERCPVAYALARLSKEGRLERDTSDGKPAWASA